MQSRWLIPETELRAAAEEAPDIDPRLAALGGDGAPRPDLAELEELLCSWGRAALLRGLAAIGRALLPRFHLQAPRDPRPQRALAAAERALEGGAAARSAARTAGDRCQELSLGHGVDGAAMDAAHIAAGTARLAALDDPTEAGRTALMRRAAFVFGARHLGAAGVVEAVRLGLAAHLLELPLPDLDEEPPPEPMRLLLEKTTAAAATVQIGLRSFASPRRPIATDGEQWEVGFRAAVGETCAVVIDGRAQGEWMGPRQVPAADGPRWVQPSWAGPVPLTDEEAAALAVARTRTIAEMLATENRLLVTGARVSAGLLPGRVMVTASVANRTPSPVRGVCAVATIAWPDAEEQVKFRPRTEPLAPGEETRFTAYTRDRGAPARSVEAEVCAGAP